MPAQHTVEQGEHLAKIAAKYGFRDYQTIWQHPNNASLRKKRPNPNVLCPGDRLFIPDKEQKKESRPTAQIHRFQVARQTVKLRIVLKDFDELPIANTPCNLNIDGKVYELVTNADGLIEQEISASAEGGSLSLPDLDMEIPIKIGHLDPPDEDSGWQARLVNLGYHWGPVGDEDAQQLGYSIEEFQCDHDLRVTGVLDAATREKLKKLHGC